MIIRVVRIKKLCANFARQKLKSPQRESSALAEIASASLQSARTFFSLSCKLREVEATDRTSPQRARRSGQHVDFYVWTRSEPSTAHDS